jgi:hypothetical protein
MGEEAGREEGKVTYLAVRAQTRGDPAREDDLMA